MEPVKFPEATKNLLKPNDMTDDECRSLWVFNDGEVCVSRWRLSFVDRLRILLYGHIWLTVHSGQTQPPVRLDSTKTVFSTVDPSFDAESIRDGAEKFA